MSLRVRVCFITVLVSLGLAWFSGCGDSKKGKFTDEEMANIPLASKDELPEPSGGLTLSVDTETITADEVVGQISSVLEPMAKRYDYSSFKERAKVGVENVITQKVADILLYKKAMQNAPENIDEQLEKAVESEVNHYVASFGGNYAEAQASIEKYGYTWETFRKFKKRMLIVQSYIMQTTDEEKPVTHAEMLNYYNEIKDEEFYNEGQLTFRLIDIAVDKIETEGDREAAAKKLVDEIVGKLEAGEDFAETAKKYSLGFRADNGGLWSTVTYGSLASPYDEVEGAARNMLPGQVSAPIDADGHIFIVKLEDKSPAGYVPFDQVQPRIEAEMNVRRKQIRFEDMVDGLVKNANIADMDRFVEYCTLKAYRMYSS